jgi:hypothetical protein
MSPKIYQCGKHWDCGRRMSSRLNGRVRTNHSNPTWDDNIALQPPQHSNLAKTGASLSCATNLHVFNAVRHGCLSISNGAITRPQKRARDGMPAVVPPQKTQQQSNQRLGEAMSAAIKRPPRYAAFLHCRYTIIKCIVQGMPFHNDHPPG